MNVIGRIAVFCCLVLVSLAGTPSHAQEPYPSKPIRMILGFAPGGISDVLGRALAQRLSTQLGQQVVVDNKPGAGGSIAAALVASAPPDGYTIWLQDMTSHAINTTMYTKLTYEPIAAFAPISLVAWTPLMLAVHPSQPTRTVAELVAFLKANPSKYSYGSAGNGTPNHLAAELLLKRAGLTSIVHIPYKGSAPTVQALLANDVAFSFLSMPPAVAAVNGGQLVGLAVTSPTRVGAAPNVPTMIEAGFRRSRWSSTREYWPLPEHRVRSSTSSTPRSSKLSLRPRSSRSTSPSAPKRSRTRRRRSRPRWSATSRCSRR